MRLIDADALLVHERFEPVGSDQYECVGFVYMDDIKNAPTIELNESEIKKKAENEVWNFVSKFMWSLEDKEILGMGITHAVRDMTYQEAKAKYEAWKTEMSKIRVGDEVILKDGNFKYIVIGFHFNTAYLLASDGSVSKFPVNKLRKLNRHFNEMEELLKKIKEKQ